MDDTTQAEAPPVTETTAPGLIDDLSAVQPPVPLSIWWFYGPLIVLIVLAAILVTMRKRIKAALENIGKPPPPDPAKDAREAIDELRKVIADITARDFVDQLSKIFRKYLEGRFPFRATSLTTQEFLKAASVSDEFEATTRQTIQKFLETCDRAKFAHLTVQKETGNHFLDWFEAFIKTTEDAVKRKEAETP